MKTIYVIVCHYFDEVKQEKANSIHSSYNPYVEALEQVEMFEQLGGVMVGLKLKRWIIIPIKLISTIST